jgi:4-amino-4-deoxy-L-arabinose transferase-like glycosyltransferase
MCPFNLDTTANGIYGGNSIDRRFWVFLVCYCIFWSVYATVSHASGTVHADMTEAWAWGQEFQLGYYKHPPLYAWLAGLWFKLFPRQDWCFFLFSSLNAAVGVIGIWYLAGQFLTGLNRIAAVMLAVAGPFYGFMAMRYNANAILLSLWPWTTFYFVRSIQHQRLIDGILFGVFCAFCLLSKYYSILLIVSCLIASFLHPDARRFYRSLCPFAAVASCALLMTPHVWWAFSHEWPTVRYALDRAEYPYSKIAYSLLGTYAGDLGFQLPSLAALWILFGGETLALLKGGLKGLFARRHLWIASLALGPLFLTFVAGLWVKISTNYTIPDFFMLPAALLICSNAMVEAKPFERLWRTAGLAAGALLVAAPIVAYLDFALGAPTATEPRAELAGEAELMWHNTYNMPLRIVAGSQYYAPAMSFYGVDAPSDFIELEPAYAPWISAARIAEQGLLIACPRSDAICAERSQAFITPETVHVAVALRHSFLGRQTVPAYFDLYMIPPRR